MDPPPLPRPFLLRRALQSTPSPANARSQQHRPGSQPHDGGSPLTLPTHASTHAYSPQDKQIDTHTHTHTHTHTDRQTDTHTRTHTHTLSVVYLWSFTVKQSEASQAMDAALQRWARVEDTSGLLGAFHSAADFATSPQQNTAHHEVWCRGGEGERGARWCCENAFFHAFTHTLTFSCMQPLGVCVCVCVCLVGPLFCSAAHSHSSHH